MHTLRLFYEDGTDGMTEVTVAAGEPYVTGIEYDVTRVVRADRNEERSAVDLEVRRTEGGIRRRDVVEERMRRPESPTEAERRSQ